MPSAAPEQQAIPVFQLLFVQVQAGSAENAAHRSARLRDRRSSGGWGRRWSCPTDAAALKHDRLPVAADVRHLPHGIVGAAAASGNDPAIPAFGSCRVRHHQLVTDITRPGIEDETFLQFETFSSKYQTGSWDTAGASLAAETMSDIPLPPGRRAGQGLEKGHCTAPAV